MIWGAFFLEVKSTNEEGQFYTIICRLKEVLTRIRKGDS